MQLTFWLVDRDNSLNREWGPFLVAATLDYIALVVFVTSFSKRALVLVVTLILSLTLFELMHLFTRWFKIFWFLETRGFQPTVNYCGLIDVSYFSQGFNEKCGMASTRLFLVFDQPFNHFYFMLVSRVIILRSPWNASMWNLWWIWKECSAAVVFKFEFSSISSIWYFWTIGFQSYW